MAAGSREVVVPQRRTARKEESTVIKLAALIVIGMLGITLLAPQTVRVPAPAHTHDAVTVAEHSSSCLHIAR